MLFRVLLLLLLMGLTYALSFILLVSVISRRIGRREEMRSRASHLFHWVVFGSAALGTLCIGWGFLFEPNWPEVTNVAVTSNDLDCESEPIRIIHLSDTHSDPASRLEPDIPDMVADLEPDLIVFTGDALNSEEGLPHFRQMMEELNALAPTFVVRGNWDVWYWSDVPLYNGTQVRVLDGEAVMVEVGGQELWVAGASVDDEAGIEAALRALPRGRPSIFLHHYPERVEIAANHDVDLVLAGDTHGGQIRLPLIGPLIEMSRFGRYFDMGLHRVRGAWLYVHRGIGMEGGSAPRVRFLCRPEIAVIELSPDVECRR